MLSLAQFTFAEVVMSESDSSQQVIGKLLIEACVNNGIFLLHIIAQWIAFPPMEMRKNRKAVFFELGLQFFNFMALGLSFTNNY